MPRGALEQAHAEMGLEAAQDFACGGARQAEIGRSSGEAAPFDEADEQAHGLEAVHGPIVQHSRQVMARAARLTADLYLTKVR